MGLTKKPWKVRRRSRSFESKKSKKPPPETKKPLVEEESQSTGNSSLPLTNIDASADDVSSIHFGESVTGSPGYAPKSISRRSPLNRLLLPPLYSPRRSSDMASSAIQFVKSDSYLDSKIEEEAEEDTSETTHHHHHHPTLSSLVYLSLICSKNPVEASHVVKESLQRHVYATLKSQPRLSSIASNSSSSTSIPVDVDNGLFVGTTTTTNNNDISDIIDDMVLGNVSKGNIKDAIDILSTLLLSSQQQQQQQQQQCHWQNQHYDHSTTIQDYVCSQLSVLYVLDDNAHMALHCAQMKSDTTSISSLMEEGMMHLFFSSYHCASQQQEEEALNCWRQAFQLQCKLVTGGNHHHRHFYMYPLLLNNMACIHYLQRRCEIALVLLEESLALQRENHAATDISGLKHMATCLLNMGVVNEQLGQFDKATCFVEEGLMVMESVVTPEDDDNVYVTCCRNTLQHLLLLRASRRDISLNTKTTMPVFGYSDGIPLRQGVTYSVETICMGSLQTELTVESRVHKAIVASIQMSSLDGGGEVGVAVSFSTSSSCVPVDLDGDFVVDAELHLSGIHAQVMRHLQREQIDEALELLRLTCKSHKLKYGNVHHLVGMTLHNIALVSLYAGRYKDSLWYFQEAVSIRVAALGTDHPDVSASMLKLGLIQMANGDLDTAYVTLTQVLHTRRKAIGGNQPEVGKILNLIGYLLYEFGSLLAALKSMEEALEILRTEEKDAADTLSNMGFLYFKLEDYTEATACYQEALDIQNRVFGDLHPKTVVTRENLEYVKQQSSHSLVFKDPVRACFWP